MSRRFWIWLTVSLGAVSLCVAGGWFWMSLNPRGLIERVATTFGNFSCLVYAGDGRQLAGGTASGNIVLWTVGAKTPLPLPRLSAQQITCLAPTADNHLIAGTLSQRLFICDLKTRKSREAPKLPAPPTCLAMHPKTDEIAIGFSDGHIDLVNTQDGKTTPLKGIHKGSVKALAYQPNGKRLVSGGADGKLIWHDVETGARETSWDGHQAEISCLMFVPGQTSLVSADWNGLLIFWNLKNGAVEHRLQQPDAVSGLGFTPSYLVTGSWDHQLRFWSVEHERIVVRYNTGEAVHGMAVSPDQRTIATVGAAPQIQIWRAPDQ